MTAQWFFSGSVSQTSPSFPGRFRRGRSDYCCIQSMFSIDGKQLDDPVTKYHAREIEGETPAAVSTVVARRGECAFAVLLLSSLVNFGIGHWLRRSLWRWCWGLFCPRTLQVPAPGCKNLSAHTAHTHLKRIFWKTDTHRQPELMVRLLSAVR
jgi:hypothetical protein